MSELSRGGGGVASNRALGISHLICLPNGRDILLCSVLALVTLACYWPVATHQFISIDDYQYIRDNDHIKSGLTWTGVAWAFTSGYVCNWHPITWLSHMLDCQLYGLDPAGHLLTNAWLHALNSVLVFILLSRITGAGWRSALVAGFFALHPMHVESVAWASERKDVLSTFFFLLTLCAYVSYARRKSLEEGSGRASEADRGIRPSGHARLGAWKRRLDYCLALAFFALGLMSKPMLVTLPCVLLLLDLWPLGRLRRGPRGWWGAGAPGLIWEKLPFFVLSASASAVTYLVQQAGGAVSSLQTTPWPGRMSNAFLSYVSYIAKTVWPSGLAIPYPYRHHIAAAEVLGAVLLLGLLTFLFVRTMARHPALPVGWLWFLGTLVPVIGLIQVGAQAMADRYMYIPSIGLLITLVWGLNAMLPRFACHKVILIPACSLLLLACFVASRFQLASWRDSEALFQHAIDVTSRNFIALDQLGGALEAQGKAGAGLALCREALRIEPNFAEAHYDVGTILMKTGNLEEAEGHLREAVRLKPKFAIAHVNLGKVYLDQGELAEAVQHFETAALLVPSDAEAHYNLGNALVRQGKTREAIPWLAKALVVKPEYPEAHAALGIALVQTGRLSEGSRYLGEAARLKPADAGSQSNFGLALMDLEQPGAAAERFSAALRLAPGNPQIEYNLALALRRQNKPNEAASHAYNALQSAVAAGELDLAGKADILLGGCLAAGP